jgi:hypothetical protein
MWGLETLLVNAYILYKETHRLVWKTSSKKILTHYKFRRAIVVAWLTGRSSIEQHENGVKRKRDSTSISTLTSSSSYSAPMTAKAPTVTDASLDPQIGSLSGRLNDSYVHYPEILSSKQPCCSLCRLLTPNKNVQKYSNVFQCDICRVHLCIQCFKPFHAITSVKHLKSHVISCIRGNGSPN